MGTIWIKEFTGGLDVRRLPETTPGGVLVRGADGHITRGGEFEKRAAFVKAYDLPAGTVGFARTNTSLVVFGHATAPTLPTGVQYQRLRHPTEGLALTEILSYDLYDGKIYAVAQFSDGSVHHFYNGTRVADWFDGRARTLFRVVSGTAPTAALNMIYVAGVAIMGSPVAWATSNAATAEAIAAEINSFASTPSYSAYADDGQVFIIADEAGAAANGRTVSLVTAGDFYVVPNTIPALSGGGSDGGMQAQGSFLITDGPGSIRPYVDGVALTAAATDWQGSARLTAAQVAADIMTYTSSPNYTATSAANQVTVITTDNTDAVNGEDITFTLTGDLSVSKGGALGTASFVVGAGVVGSTIIVKIDGVSLFTTAVAFASTATVAAAAIAAAINAHTSSPDYTATSSDTKVTISTATMTASHNGKTLTFTKVGTFPTSSVTAVSGGSAPATTMVPMSGGKVDDAFTPGTFVKTVGSKVYSTAGSILHFSGIKAPKRWTTDAVGAGFINLASENSGSEQLTAVERYQSLLAVFAPEVVQVWYIDPDPELNRQSQILNNTGTSAPRSVTQFGDDDIFYLDASGLRSLRARDSSNAASTTDIGVPIDALLTAKMAGMTDAERNAAIGLINPLDKRFWLIMKDEVFVFSFYGNAKVSAWTTYNLTAFVGGDETPFTADAALTHRGRVYIRSGNAVYVYGGISGDPTYDEVQAEAWLPFLDANVPTTKKNWTGVDVAVSGVWQISAAMEPTLPDYAEVITVVDQTTFNMGRVPMGHSSTHLGLRCRSIAEGPAVLSAAIIHYEGSVDED